MVPLERLERSLPAPEAGALSTELRGLGKHRRYRSRSFHAHRTSIPARIQAEQCPARGPRGSFEALEDEAQRVFEHVAQRLQELRPLRPVRRPMVRREAGGHHPPHDDLAVTNNRSRRGGADP